MKTLALSNGYTTTLDDDDYEAVSKYKWGVCKKDGLVYAQRSIQRGGISTKLLMHREIMKAPVGLLVDHRNGNSLDNVKGNLRLCDAAQNIWNSKKKRNGRYRFKGSIYIASRDKWRANLTYRGKELHLGYYDTEEEAGIAYNVAAQLYFGEFARLNSV